MQRQTEKVEKFQLKSVTTKETTQKQKEKTQSAKQVETSTGISTGSSEKEKHKEKSPNIMSREASTVLPALSTSTKQKGRQKRENTMYFKTRRSTWIKVARPKPESKEPITIEDATTKQEEESHSKITITYE